MADARQQSSTAYPILLYMVLSSDHVTPATGKTLTVTLSKNGGAFASASGSVSEIANGWYALAGNATDRNTLGPLAIKATASSCDDVAKVVDIVTSDPFAASSGGASAADVWTYTTRTLTGGPDIITGATTFYTREIVRGNDYSSGNQPFTLSLANSDITDLDTYTWTFTANKSDDNLETGDASFTGTVAVTQATGASRAVRVDFAATTTDSLAIGYYNGALRGTIAGKPATQVFVLIKVLDDPNQA